MSRYLKITLTLIFLIVFSIVIGSSQNAPTQGLEQQFVPKSAFAQDENSCVSFVKQAFSGVGTNCAGLDSNSACNGFAGGKSSASGFDAVGGRIDLSSGDSFTTTRLDVNAKTFGVVVINSKANYPVETSDNVVIVAAGDVTIEDATGNANALAPMQAFNFKTGQGSGCTSAPPDSILVQGASNQLFSIIANGALIEGTGTIFLRNVNANTMRIAVGAGNVTLFSGEVNEVNLYAGVSVDAPLDADGQTLGSWAGWQYGAAEMTLYNAFTDLPSNILNSPYSGMNFFQASGVSTPPPPIPPYTPPPFPTPGEDPQPGQDLPLAGFDTIGVGAKICRDNIYFHGDLAVDNWDIYRLASNNQINNVTNGDISNDIMPSISQDGEWVAFTSDRPGDDNWELYVVKGDGTEIQRITFNSGTDINPAWGPDGKIVFESYRDGDWELYLVDLTKSLDLTRLTEDEGQDVNAYWLPEKESILFQSDRDGDWEIYELVLETNELTQLTDNEIDDIVPVGSHDESEMIWTQEDANGIHNLWRMDFETDETEQLTDTGASITGYTYEPDDTFVAYHRRSNGDFDVIALGLEDRDADGKPIVKNLTENQANANNDGFDDQSPTFRCDNPIVIFNSNRVEEQHDLFQVNPLPLDGPFNPPTRLTFEEEASEIFPLADQYDENNSLGSPVHGLVSPVHR